MKSISGYIATIMAEQNIISNDDVAKVKYGLDGFIISAFEIISILIIAAIVGNFAGAVLLFVAFIPLRLYAGGYHADTKLKCYLVSLGMYVAFTLITELSVVNSYMPAEIGITVFSLIVVLITAPVIPPSKSVNDVERKYYRKFSLYICLVETLVILLLAVVAPSSPGVFALSFGQGAVTVSMVAAKIKGKITDNKYKQKRKEVR